MTNKDNRPLIPESWSKEIEDQLSVNNIADVFGVPTKIFAPRKRTMKEKIYLHISRIAMKVFGWSDKKYRKELLRKYER